MFIMPTAMRNIYRRVIFVGLCALVLTWGAWLVHTASTDVEGTAGGQGLGPQVVGSITVYSPKGPVAVKDVRIEKPIGLVGDSAEATHGGALLRPW